MTSQWSPHSLIVCCLHFFFFYCAKNHNEHIIVWFFFWFEIGKFCSIEEKNLNYFENYCSGKQNWLNLSFCRSIYCKVPVSLYIHFYNSEVLRNFISFFYLFFWICLFHIKYNNVSHSHFAQWSKQTNKKFFNIDKV